MIHEAAGVVVGAPFAGRPLMLNEVPDPVFAQGMVGAGAAVEPLPDAGRLTVLAPLAGKVVKAMPHAVVLQSPRGFAVLVHVGIDTVTLGGEGFELLAEEGSEVEAGEALVEFDAAVVRGRGLSPVCPVVVLDTAKEHVTPTGLDGTVRGGERLFTVHLFDVRD